MSLFRLIVPLVALALAGCSRDNDGALEVVFIDSAENLFETGLRLSSGAQHVRAATESGLVALNAEGEVVPALADRWIVTDDGRSFIFRLRDGTWPDGSELTAESVRAELRSAIRALRGTSLGLDLAPIEEVRAMAGRVVEIRLSSPVPMLLQILAQPELALSRGEGGSGPMTIERDGGAGRRRCRGGARRARGARARGGGRGGGGGGGGAGGRAGGGGRAGLRRRARAGGGRDGGGRHRHRPARRREDQQERQNR